MSRTISNESKYSFLLPVVRKLDPGQAHLATRGQEFTCEVATFVSAVYAAAATKGYKATVATFPDLGMVVFAFYLGADYLKPNLSAYPAVIKLRKY
jgi:hypothetical protein